MLRTWLLAGLCANAVGVGLFLQFFATPTGVVVAIAAAYTMSAWFLATR